MKHTTCNKNAHKFKNRILSVLDKSPFYYSDMFFLNVYRIEDVNNISDYMMSLEVMGDNPQSWFILNGQYKKYCVHTNIDRNIMRAVGTELIYNWNKTVLKRYY